MKHETVSRYATLFSLLGTEAWFLWNPDGWKFELEPVVVFIGLLATYIMLDLNNKSAHPNDITLFKNLQESLPSSGAILFIKEHDFAGSFPLYIIKPFNQFNREWDNAEHEFIDSELEAARKDLLEKSKTFSTVIAYNTSPNNFGFQSAVPDSLDIDIDFPSWLKQDVKEIHAAADGLVKSHQDIVRLGQKKLHID